MSSNGGLTSSINSGNYNNPGSLDIINDNYSFSLIRYPANIMMYNFSINKYSISYLDYGIFEDKLHDIVNQRFSAHEVMIQYNHNSKIRNNTIGFSLGLFHSNIYIYNAFGLSGSIGFNSFYKLINSSLALSIENIGYILKSYTTHDIPIPIKYRFSFNKNLKSFTIGYDLLYSKYINRFEHIICFQFIPHDKVKIRFSNTSNSEDLLIDDNSNFFTNIQQHEHHTNLMDNVHLYS